MPDHSRLISSAIPIVSVLMPVHNAGRYLRTAVASILTQTLSELELVLIDDHSTDDAIATLRIEDPRLRVVRAQKRGLVHALNQGLELAQGEFIARMDSDDISHPDRLAKQHQLIQQFTHPALIGARVSMFTDTGHCEGGYDEYERWINTKISAEQTARAIFIESPLPHPTLFCHRETLCHLGGYRDLGWPEDYDLWLRAWQKEIPIVKPHPVLLRWRDHPNRWSRINKVYAAEQFIRLKAHFLAQHMNAPVTIWGAGRGGKRLYDALSAEGVTANAFIDVSKKRIGGTARGRPVRSPHTISATDGTLLVAVGTRGVRPQIRAFLNQLGRIEGEDYWFTA